MPILFFLLFLCCPIWADINTPISVVDDTQQTITLTHTAQRVISLSPAITEMVYAVGGAASIQATVDYSNYPEQAQQLPVIGSYKALDIERIIQLQPDLIIAWKSGNPRQQIAQLKQLGFIVYMSEPRNFSDISHTLINLGKLLGTSVLAKQKAHSFQQQLQRLIQRYSRPEQTKKRVFIQIWNNPVMTVNQQHLISKVVTICNGENIFAHVSTLTFTPTLEAILHANPDIILSTGMEKYATQWLQQWQQWPLLTAVKKQQLYAIPPDYIVRHTPRILLGIQSVCKVLNPNI